MAYVSVSQRSGSGTSSSGGYVPIADRGVSDDGALSDSLSSIPDTRISNSTPAIAPSIIDPSKETLGAKGVFNIGKEVLKSVAQGVARSTAASGAAITAIPERARAFVTNTQEKPGTGQFQPVGKVQKSIYGTEKPVSLESTGEEFGAKAAGLPPVVIGAFGSILDLAGAEGARGIEGLTASLKAAKTETQALKLMKSAGFADDIAKDYVSVFSKTSDAKKIREGLLSAEKLQNTTKAAKTAEGSYVPVANRSAEAFGGFDDVSTKLVEKLKGKSNVSKQFISDLSNSPDLKQSERDLIRKMLKDEGDEVNVPEFANKVKSELLPLNRGSAGGLSGGNQYENISLPDNLRGPIAGYSEHIYNSPISTRAADVHFSSAGNKNYFAHTRIEDLPALEKVEPSKTKSGLDIFRPRDEVDRVLGKWPTGDTRRVIELQSDLFQKGRLENEINNADTYAAFKVANPESKITREEFYKNQPLKKLEPYRNTWHERVIRQEIKQAAIDGKTKLQFPTGETAMKIEGLGQGENSWYLTDDVNVALEGRAQTLSPENLKVGETISHPANGEWVVTDVLGDGKFKAVPKEKLDGGMARGKMFNYSEKMGENEKAVLERIRANYEETFDISGKLDTENPIYKFYEKEIGKYLKNKYDAKLITDPQGVKWWEVPVRPDMKIKPVEAFGAAGGIQTDDKGNISFNPLAAVLGVAGAHLAREVSPEIAAALKKGASKDEVIALLKKAGLSDDISENVFRKISKGMKVSDIEKTIAEGAPLAEKKPVLPVKKVPEVEKFDPGFRQNLIRDLAREAAPGRIADSLTKEFPRLPSGIVDSAANRLKRMNRTSDITGILQALTHIQETVKNKTGVFEPGRFVADKAFERGKGFKNIADVMKPRQKDSFLRTTTEYLKDKEKAILAQQEYEALWEQSGQEVINRYNIQSLEHDFVREAVDNDPAKSIFDAIYKPFGRSPSDSAFELQQVWERAQQGKGLSGIPRERLKVLDKTIEAAGFKDFADAQAALEVYEKNVKKMKEMQSDLKDLRAHVSLARKLQEFIDDVPVVAREEAGAIDVLANSEWVQKHYKDITGWKGQVVDVYRNFENFFGDKYALAKKAILDPFDVAKGARIEEIKKLGDELDANIVKKFGFKRGSKYSEAIQRYGDTGLEGGDRFSKEDLISKFGNDKAEEIIKADAWFRKTYDRLIDEVNAVRERIYPNNPNKMIPKRNDYYRHFQELGGTFRELQNIFETPAGIDPKLVGVSENTKPRSRFLPFAEERLGKKTTMDAIGGFLNYADYFAYAKHIDPQIGIFRYLKKRLDEVAPIAGTMQGGMKQKSLEHFSLFIHNFANDLAGKTNPVDRFLQDTVPGGRKAFKAITWVNSRVKANVILGNLSSAVAQLFNIPQGIASAKLYSIHGASRSLASIFMENVPMNESIFIKERYREDLANRFKIEWLEHPFRASSEYGKEFAAWITGVGDEIGTKFIWNAHYAKGVAEGIEDPVKYADDAARKMVAGRGVGEVPLFQKSKLVQFGLPFQLEVQNSWHVMGDFVKRKDFGALAIFFMASYLMNEAAKKVRGSPVVFDPINATIDGITQMIDEMDAGESPARASLKLAGREAGEVFSNVLGGQTIAAMVPDELISKATGGNIQDKKDLFGTGDPGRFGSGPLVMSSISDPLFKLLPPFAGVQAEKTLQAIKSMLVGHVDTKAGKMSFKTPTDPLSVVQAILFGKNSTAEAQKAYAERDDLFQRVYRQTLDRTNLGIDAENEWVKMQKLRDAGKGQEALTHLKEIAKKNPNLAKQIITVAKEQKAGLDGTDRMIGMLNVDNGERAKYLVDVIKKMPKEQRNPYMKSLVQKKILSKTVAAQMAYLMAH